MTRRLATAPSISLSNACARPLTVWLEPWAQEYSLSSRATLDLLCKADDDRNAYPELDVSGDLITVWAAGGTTIDVTIDGIDQDSFSGSCPAPDIAAITPRRFIELAFGDCPAARPGGLPLAGPPAARPGRLWRLLASSARR